jgi:hypothetical protein
MLLIYIYHSLFHFRLYHIKLYYIISLKYLDYSISYYNSILYYAILYPPHLDSAAMRVFQPRYISQSPGHLPLLGQQLLHVAAAAARHVL